MTIELEAWIARKYSGLGRALRNRDDPPLEGEPWMSMAEAKELTRQAVAIFALPDAALLIERCAKIADPWPESDGKSEVDAVRREIAAHIRLMKSSGGHSTTPLPPHHS